MSTQTTTKLSLATLKACKGSVGGYYKTSEVSVAIAPGHDDVLYMTNSYALARADRFAHIWAASNLELTAGRYTLNGHVQPDPEASVPDLARITQDLAKAPELLPAAVAGKQLMIDLDGPCYLFGDIDNNPTACKRQLIDVYLGEVATWRGAGPTKPVSAWDYKDQLIGCVMPVRIS